MAYKNHFEGGELDKWTLGAVDDPMYARGVAWLENFQPLENGGINRRAGYKRICKILDDCPAIKMVPVSVDAKTAYILYVTSNYYGFIKFENGEFTKHVQKAAPAPFVISDEAHSVKFNERDPDAHYTVEGISNIASEFDIPPGAVVDLNLPYAVEQAVMRIKERVDGSAGYAFEINPAFVKAEPHLFDGDITQEYSVEEGACYFDEKGAGRGLSVKCKIGKIDEKTRKGIIEFEVMARGTGFEGGPDGFTQLTLMIPGIGETVCRGQVGADGGIGAVEQTEFFGVNTLQEKQRYWRRWKAAPPDDGQYSKFSDFAGNVPANGSEPTVMLSTAEAPALPGGGAFPPLYNISFEVVDGGDIPGLLFVPLARTLVLTEALDADGNVIEEDEGGEPAEVKVLRETFVMLDGRKFYTETVENGVSMGVAPGAREDLIPDDVGTVFLRLLFSAEVDKVLCDRTINCVGDLKMIYGEPEEGGTVLELSAELKSVNPVLNWYDDGCALADGSDAESTAAWAAADKHHTWKADGSYLGVYAAASVPGGAGTYRHTWAHGNTGLWYGKAFRRAVSSVITGYQHSGVCGHPIYSSRVSTVSLTDASAPRFSAVSDSCRVKNSVICDRGDDAGQPKMTGTAVCPVLYAMYGDGFADTTKALVNLKCVNESLYDFAPLNNETAASSNMELEKVEDKTLFADSAEAVKGKDAVLGVKSRYIHGDDPRVEFRVRVIDGGTGYFRRQGADALVCSLLFDAAPQTAAARYSFTVPAQQGTDNAVVLRDGAGEFVTVLPAKLKSGIPEDGDAQLSKYAGGKATGDFVSVTIAAEIYHAGDNAEAAHEDADGWELEFEVKTMPNGKPRSSLMWKVGDATVFATKTGNAPGGSVAAIDPTRSYITELVSSGKYKQDVKDYVAALSIAGVNCSAAAVETAYHEKTVLKKIPAPDSLLYRVETDELFDGIPTYWKYVNREWKQQVQLAFPALPGLINSLQYVYNGKITAFAGRGCLPFAIEIKDDGLSLAGFTPVCHVSYDLTAPEEFKYRPVNKVYDPAIPVGFCLSLAASPSVIYYDNGRWWFASTPDDPGRIWVSKPVKDKENLAPDFTTYMNFLTVSPVVDAFSGSQKLGTNEIKSLSDGALGLARDGLLNETKGKDVTFGVVNPEIIGTPYFKDGAKIIRADGGLFLDKNSAAIPKEYYADDLADLNKDVNLYLTIAKLRVTIPLGFGAAGIDCGGFEVYTQPAPVIPLPAAVGAVIAGDSAPIAVPWTAWGTGAEAAGRIVSAAACAGTSQLKSPPAAIALATATLGVLTAGYFTAKAILKALMESVFLKTTDGTELNASEDDLGLGGLAITPEHLLFKRDYLLTKCKLYEEAQPFLMRRWKVDEKHYSTAGCGFTFVMSSDEKEDVHFISNNRAFFIGTSSSERIMPATVNGEAQSAQTGSFYGSERVMPAKAQDSLFFVQRGGQRLMRAYWQPNTAVPSAQDLQRYNREILRRREIISLKSSKNLPSRVWCVMADGAAAVAADAGGITAWGRVSSGAGKILDTAALPGTGADAMRTVAIDTEKGVYLCASGEGFSDGRDVFLDCYEPFLSQTQKDGYREDAVILDAKTYQTWPLSDDAPPGENKYIGYRYMTKMRTLPSPEMQALAPVRIPKVRLRFMESLLPFIAGFPSGGRDKITLPGFENKVIDGVVDAPVPGNVELDAAFEVYTDECGPLSIVCLLTEDEV